MMNGIKIRNIFLLFISFVLVACAGESRFEVKPILQPGALGTDIGVPEAMRTATRESDDEEKGGKIWVDKKPIRSQEYGNANLAENVGEIQIQNTNTPVIDATVEISRLNACSPLVSVPIEELRLVMSASYDPPPAGRDERHHGVDFAYYRKYGRETVAGEQVQAVFPGDVAAVIRDSYPYGNLVIIEIPLEILAVDFVRNEDIQPGESLYLLYAHLEWAAEIEPGERVNSCQVIGAVGKSGSAGVAHLHLEARIGPAGSRFRRMAYYTIEASQEERETYLRWRTSGQYRHIDPMKLFLQILDQ